MNVGQKIGVLVSFYMKFLLRQQHADNINSNLNEKKTYVAFLCIIFFNISFRSFVECIKLLKIMLVIVIEHIFPLKLMLAIKHKKFL